MSLFSLDSSYLPSQAKKVDCHALPSDNARNDSKNATNKKVDSSDEAFLSSLRDFALAKSWQSTPPKPQTLESTFSPQANSLSLSSRDFRKEVVAIHNQKADSSLNALSCHIEPQAKYLLSLRDFALAKSWQSTPPKTQILESTFDKTAQKSQSVASLEKVDSSMDCHAIATALARNDSKNATKQKVDKKADSRIFTQAAQSLNNSQGENAQNAFDSQVAGGRIFDEKAGLCSGEQGDKTRVSIDAASHKLPAFSQKANAQTEQSRIA